MSQVKPTIYLDTNIASVLHYRGSNIGTLHQQMVTREWWETERKWFRVWASTFTEGELSQGSYLGQEQALRLIGRLPFLPFTAAVRHCARVFLDERLVPREYPGDAVQLAFATVHRVDYLLTWNYAHLANLDTQRKLMRITTQQGWRTPYLVSPESIPRVALGQLIRRKDSDI
jgi:hypothetical protein